MGVAIYGNYGAPLLAFPTSMGDEWEQEGQGMIPTLSPYIEQGRIRIFCINGVQSDSFSNKGAHPFHRSWMQAQYDAYVANEVFPFIDSIAGPRLAKRLHWKSWPVPGRNKVTGTAFVVGLVGPLVTEPDLSFVKGFYERPELGGVGGGRVTELAARPLLSMYFPELAGIVTLRSVTAHSVTDCNTWRADGKYFFNSSLGAAGVGLHLNDGKTMGRQRDR